MYSTKETLTLSGKDTGGIAIHPIVEIRLVGGTGGGFVQIVPLVLILEFHGEIFTYRMDRIENPDEQSADNAV